MAGDQAYEIAHLKSALERRTTIGMAVGIMMERYDLNRAEAFPYVQRLSSTRERNLYDVARGLVETRRPARGTICLTASGVGHPSHS